MVFTAEKGMADEVWLKNGDHITGKLVRLENNLLIFNTSYAGEISIKWEEIANFRTETAVTVVLSDATSAKGFISPGGEGTVIVKSEQIKEPFTVELASFKMINPSPPKPPLKVKARVNFGANISKGNTDTENIYGDGEFVARTKKSRYTLGGSYKRSEDNNQKTADSVIGYTKYDYFLSEKWYLFANAIGEKDEFKDLNLRTAVGPGVGYQFLETEMTNLALEASLNYVNEDFIVA